MRRSFQVTTLIFAENGQGLVDIGRLFSSPLPQKSLVKKFYTAKNLVAVIGFSHIMLIYFSMAGTASECCSSECHVCSKSHDLEHRVSWLTKLYFILHTIFVKPFSEFV